MYTHTRPIQNKPHHDEYDFYGLYILLQDKTCTMLDFVQTNKQYLHHSLTDSESIEK